MRTFAYCRVSTSDLTTDNQIHTIRNSGYEIDDSRVITETVSGSVQAMKRHAFKMLVEHKLESGDRLVVSKLDRLGRDNIDVQSSISMLMDKGIQVVSLDLPVTDLASSEGRLMLQMFSAFAEFEWNRIRERTREGLSRAKSQGVKLGRPEARATTARVQTAKLDGFSQRAAALNTGLSLATIKRHWNKCQ